MDEEAARIVERFHMQPHPEGGYFAEIHRSALEVARPAGENERAAARRACTQIYFLLADDQFSAFHRVRGADEIWHVYGGGALELHIIDGSGRHECRQLSTSLEHGAPVGIVPADAWQAARLSPDARWVWVGCTVAPGFEFTDFEMPPAEELVAKHPEHAAIIRELTRS